MTHDAQTAPEAKPKAEIDTPKGTVAVLAVYSILLIALWGFMYMVMVVRGG